MADPSKDELEITNPQVVEAARQFHLVYGAAMAEWSRLEGQLFYWFQLLTGMDEKTARAVFFSARNFNARADMLEAALKAENPGGPIQYFLEAALKKARGYSGFRNSATHGEPHINIQRGSPTVGQFVIIQGRKVSYEAEATMITMQHLIAAQKNFQRLAGSLFATYPGDGPTTASLLETHRELVLQLPNQPHSTADDPSPSEPNPPR
jgi:hypothetical protein